MNWQKRFLNFVFATGLGAGLLIAQICNVACIAANCMEEKQIAAPAPAQSSSHCHKTEVAQEIPASEDESHKCQNHDLTVLLAASELATDLTVQLDWPVGEFTPAWLAMCFSPQLIDRGHLASLRSPPRLPQRLNLRI